MSFTYDTLKAAVTAVAEDSGAEFDAYFDTALVLAQERMVRDLDNYGLVLHAITSVSAGDYFVTRPVNVCGAQGRTIKSLALIDRSSGEHTPLLLVTDEFISDYWPVRASLGTPTYYAQWDNDAVIIAPTPSARFDYEMSFVARPTVISAAMQNNWFTDFAGDALFFSTMIEMSRFARNAEMMASWKASYDEAIGALRNEARMSRRDDQRMPASPTSENTVTGS
jgi:hypothetical protein